MARKSDGAGLQRIVNGASLPTGSGNVEIHLQGFTSNDAYGSETFADRLAAAPHDENIL